MFASVLGTTGRHFTDALLNAREQFIADDRGAAVYLTDGNVRQAVMDIFAAGLDTSRSILGYALLHLANDPQLQVVTHKQMFFFAKSRTRAFNEIF